jgi:hypothetical protein
MEDGVKLVKDEDGKPLKSGDYITFSFGIPPTSVLCRINSTGGPLVAECLDPPSVKPRTEKLASLMNWYQVWKASTARVTDYNRLATPARGDGGEG